MSRTLSQAYRHNASATGADEPVLTFLLIDHALLDDSVRVVNDTQEFPYGEDYRFEAGAAYALNQMLVPTEYNGYYYKCTSAGTAAGTEPTWPTTLTNTVVSGGATFRCEGLQYAACGFECTLPDDVEKQAPRANLSVDNVSAEIGRAIEDAQGARGATCRMMQALRSQPTTLEIDITLDLSGIKINAHRVTGQLSFKNLLDVPAIRMTYTPKTAPGVF